MEISAETKELFTALAKFQKTVADPKKDKVVNYGKTKFTYADLDSVLKAVRPLLAEQGLSFTQVPVVQEGKVGVTTILMHESGQYIQTDPFLIPAKQQDAQGYGSCITYAKRYSLSALLGVSSDEDDDGNYGSGTDKKPEYMNRQGNARQQSQAQYQANSRQQNRMPTPDAANGQQNRMPTPDVANAAGQQSRMPTPTAANGSHKQQSQMPTPATANGQSDWLKIQQGRMAEKCKNAGLDERFVIACMEVKFKRQFKSFTLDDYTSFVTNFDAYIAETQEEAMKRYQGAR